MFCCNAMQGAHEVLVSLWRSVAKAGQPLPVEAMRALALLHSYLLLRPLTALGEHEVCMPTLGILTCTVVCSRCCCTATFAAAPHCPGRAQGVLSRSRCPAAQLPPAAAPQRCKRARGAVPTHTYAAPLRRHIETSRGAAKCMQQALETAKGVCQFQSHSARPSSIQCLLTTGTVPVL